MPQLCLFSGATRNTFLIPLKFPPSNNFRRKKGKKLIIPADYIKSNTNQYQWVIRYYIIQWDQRTIRIIKKITIAKEIP